MRRIFLPCLIFILGATALPVIAQKADRRTAAAEQEARQFFDAYAEDLRNHRREAVADRYDRRGVFMMGNGNKSLATFEGVKDRYLTKWKGPKSFQWKDLSFDVLAPNVVAVLGKFEWETVDSKVLSFSYTGILIKRDGQWRIRVEDESTKP